MSTQYIPERSDLVWLDFEPTRGREIGKYRPALILSSKLYNQKTGLIICTPISTSIRGAITEVPINNLDKPCVAAANLIHTLDWRSRNIKKAGEAEPGVLQAILQRLLPIIGAETLAGH